MAGLQGTTKNELMLRYAQYGRLRGVATLLAKGADINYRNGELLRIAIFMQKPKIFKLCLRANITAGLHESLALASKLEQHGMAEELQDYITRKGF